jgi:hypothetical protein
MTRECREHEDGSATKETQDTKHEHEGARRFAPIPTPIELVSSQIWHMQLVASVRTPTRAPDGALRTAFLIQSCLSCFFVFFVFFVAPIVWCSLGRSSDLVWSMKK